MTGTYLLSYFHVLSQLLGQGAAMNGFHPHDNHLRGRYVQLHRPLSVGIGGSNQGSVERKHLHMRQVLALYVYPVIISHYA